MTIREAVQIADKTATIQTFGDGFWVKGNGWETKATYSEERAWELAQARIFQSVAACTHTSAWHKECEPCMICGERAK